jgi:hypothetical protein
MKPMTIGCLSLYEIKAITEATIMMTVKSCTTGPISITITAEPNKKSQTPVITVWIVQIHLHNF